MSADLSFFHQFPQDEQAFEALFKEHYPSLVSFSFHYLKDWDEAEEVVQEVFTNIWEKSKNIRLSGSIKGYLMGSVRNASLNVLKHQKIVSAHASRKDALIFDVIEPMEYDELNDRITQALDMIPEKCREIFELNRFEGKRYKEIAEELGISLKTVENQMGKALKIMRNELKDFIPFLLWVLLRGGNF